MNTFAARGSRIDATDGDKAGCSGCCINSESAKLALKNNYQLAGID